MIELAISGMDSTVPVTSRSAYSFRSAGARSSVAAHMTQPTVDRRSTNSPVASPARQPGIASSLSSVPPVWPSPRPESWGTAAPQLATSGARISDTLSPTPPVECLSTVGAGTALRSSRWPEPIIASVQARNSPGPARGRRSPSPSRTSARRRSCPWYKRRSASAMSASARRQAVSLGPDQVDDIRHRHLPDPRYRDARPGPCR